jgi:hypothetical protein
MVKGCTVDVGETGTSCDKEDKDSGKGFIEEGTDIINVLCRNEETNVVNKENTRANCGIILLVMEGIDVTI